MFLPFSKNVFNYKVPVKELTKKALEASEWELLYFVIKKLSAGPPYFRCPLLDQSTETMSWAFTRNLWIHILGWIHIWRGQGVSAKQFLEDVVSTEANKSVPIQERSQVFGKANHILIHSKWDIKS